LSLTKKRIFIKLAPECLQVELEFEQHCDEGIFGKLDSFKENKKYFDNN
jgi:hypothetical protein